MSKEGTQGPDLEESRLQAHRFRACLAGGGGGRLPMPGSADAWGQNHLPGQALPRPWEAMIQTGPALSLPAKPLCLSLGCCSVFFFCCLLPLLFVVQLLVQWFFFLIKSYSGGLPG